VFDFTWLTNFANPQLWPVATIPNVEKQAKVMSQLKKDFSYEQFREVVM
jgi:hypothetical protein